MKVYVLKNGTREYGAGFCCVWNTLEAAQAQAEIEAEVGPFLWTEDPNGWVAYPDERQVFHISHEPVHTAAEHRALARQVQEVR